MSPFLFWVAVLFGTFPMSAVLLVMLGQPVRPLGHLLKASAFWTIVAWIISIVLVSVL